MKPFISDGDRAAISILELLAPEIGESLSTMWQGRDPTVAHGAVGADALGLDHFRRCRDAGLVTADFTNAARRCGHGGEHVIAELELTARGRWLVRRRRHFEACQEATTAEGQSGTKETGRVVDA